MNEKYFFTIEKARLGDLDFITLSSPSLKNRADICVFKPENSPKNIPVVILLHGVYGSHWAWALKAKVHLILQNLINQKKIKPMLLVMPSDGLFQDGSGYLVHKTADFEQWIAKDVVKLIKESYEEVTEFSPFFISGLSMGGYGALRLGAKYPSIFQAFSGLSSITKFNQFEQFVQNYEGLKNSVIDEENVFEILLKNKKFLNPFRFDCGKNDPLFEANLLLHQHLLENNIPHEFKINEGEHNWDYWKENIAETLLFFSRYCEN